MLQRIQTIFLLLAGAGFIALFYTPFATSDISTGELLADTRYTVEDHILLGGLCLLGGILSLVAIFLYKNRPLQLRFGYFVIVAAILLIVASILIFMQDVDNQAADFQISEGLGLGIPILTIVFIVLANRYIKKDEKLVRSMDRLR